MNSCTKCANGECPSLKSKHSNFVRYDIKKTCTSITVPETECMIAFAHRAPVNTALFGDVIDKMTATKNVLSPTSEQITVSAAAPADRP